MCSCYKFKTKQGSDNPWFKQNQLTLTIICNYVSLNINDLVIGESNGIYINKNSLLYIFFLLGGDQANDVFGSVL